MIIKLSKPVKFEGEDISSLDLDLEALTGADLKAIKHDYLKLKAASASAKDRATNPVSAILQNESIALLLSNSDFVDFVAARAAKRPVELIGALTMRDYLRVQTEVSNFFNS